MNVSHVFSRSTTLNKSSKVREFQGPVHYIKHMLGSEGREQLRAEPRLHKMWSGTRFFMI